MLLTPPLSKFSRQFLRRLYSIYAGPLYPSLLHPAEYPGLPLLHF